MSAFFEGLRTAVEPSGATFRVVRNDGSVRWVRSWAYPSVASSGEVEHIAGICVDITEQQVSELRLRQAERLASIGLLGAELAHEISNPLAYVGTNLDFLADALGASEVEASRPSGLDAEVRRAVADAQHGVDRLSGIVANLKALASGDDQGLALLDVREVAQAAISLAANTIQKRARLVTSLDQVPLLLANETRLGQVFLNLLINAAQAIPAGDPSQHEVRVTTSASNDGVIDVAVRDSGSGISEADRERIFDPFFSTKIGIGTGLGLYICKNFVEELGGSLEVESVEGSGACFTVSLPAAAREDEDDPFAEITARVARSAARVLVIDDEPIIGRSLERILQPQCEVSVCTTGREALALLAQGERFDAILCDLTMPDMSGLEVHAAIARQSPNHAHRLIFVTGGAVSPEAQSMLKRARFVIRKPFTAEEVRATVQKMFPAA